MLPGRLRRRARPKRVGRVGVANDARDVPDGSKSNLMYGVCSVELGKRFQIFFEVIAIGVGTAENGLSTVEGCNTPSLKAHNPKS